MARPQQRGFSENKAILEENIDQESITSCYINVYMHANNWKPNEIKIIDPMILSVRSARRQYEHYIENLKISKEDQSLT